MVTLSCDEVEGIKTCAWNNPLLCNTWSLDYSWPPLHAEARTHSSSYSNVGDMLTLKTYLCDPNIILISENRGGFLVLMALTKAIVLMKLRMDAPLWSSVEFLQKT